MNQPSQKEGRIYLEWEFNIMGKDKERIDSNRVKIAEYKTKLKELNKDIEDDREWMRKMIF